MARKPEDEKRGYDAGGEEEVGNPNDDLIALVRDESYQEKSHGSLAKDRSEDEDGLTDGRVENCPRDRFHSHDRAFEGNNVVDISAESIHRRNRHHDVVG